MITLETIVAMALRHEGVLDRLGSALRSDLVLANPFLRRIVEFAAGFKNKYRKLPSDGDWSVWLEALTRGLIHDGTREALGRLVAVDLEDYDPAYYVDAVLPLLKEGAERVARARINEEVGEIKPGTIATVAKKLEGISLDPAPASLWLTLGQVMRGEHLGDEDLSEPEELIARLAWRGRHVMLTGREKLGKSTFVGVGVVAFTRSRLFFQEPAEDDNGPRGPRGRVLWLSLDESRSDALPRLLDNGAFPTRIAVVNPAVPDKFLARVLSDTEQRPDLVVVDSLNEYARRVSREMPSSGDSAGWAQIVRPLTGLAHEYGVGIVTISHARKSDGEFRDSTEIAAAMDGTVTMLPPTENQEPNVRRIRFVGRRSIARRGTAFAVRLVQRQVEVPLPGGSTTLVRDAYELVEAAQDASDQVPRMKERLETFVAANPGSSRQQVLEAVGGDRNAANRELDALVQAGRLRREGTGTRNRAFQYFPPGKIDEGTAGEEAD